VLLIESELLSPVEWIAVAQVVAAAAVASAVWMESESESVVAVGVAESASFGSCSSFLSSGQSPGR